MKTLLQMTSLFQSYSYQGKLLKQLKKNSPSLSCYSLSNFLSFSFFSDLDFLNWKSKLYLKGDSLSFVVLIKYS